MSLADSITIPLDLDSNNLDGKSHYEKMMILQGMKSNLELDSTILEEDSDAEDDDDDDDEVILPTRRMSFAMQMGPGEEEEGVESLAQKRESMIQLSNNMVTYSDDVNTPFESMFEPDEMRCLALVAHNHMKPAMKAFIETHSEILKKFRLTGTNTTMKMLEDIFVDDPHVVYGPTCTSGPLGGDAQLCALMCLENLGGVMFFMDPLSAHPHQADIDSLVRLANVNNVILCPNPTTACAMMHMLRKALISGKQEMIPSFFETLESPSVDAYKRCQKSTLDSLTKG